ncbi:hypothetical protein [Microbacterium sp. GXF0217]
MSEGVSQVYRYPKHFEYYRLEAFGDQPEDEAYYDVDIATRLYDEGRGIFVIPAGEPPSWALSVSAGSHRFSLTFYNEHKTPLRQVTWERQADGGLFCRETIDLFYPDGDPGGRVPFIRLVTVTQEFSTDGVLVVTVSSPVADDDVREVTGVPIADMQSPVPSFGGWGTIVAASAPADVDRFGPGSVQAALAHADRCAAQGNRSEPDRSPADGWRIPLADRGVMKAIDAILDSSQVQAGIPVIARGQAQVLPLVLQRTPVARGRDPREEQRRMRIFADGIRSECEHEQGQQIAVDLERQGSDSVASYARALRDAGATRAVWWVFRSTFGVVLVWTGDETVGNLTLSLHVVPASWVWERRSEAEISGIDVAWTADDLARALDHARHRGVREPDDR